MNQAQVIVSRSIIQNSSRLNQRSIKLSNFYLVKSIYQTNWSILGKEFRKAFNINWIFTKVKGRFHSLSFKRQLLHTKWTLKWIRQIKAILILKKNLNLKILMNFIIASIIKRRCLAIYLKSCFVILRILLTNYQNSMNFIKFFTCLKVRIN